MVSGLASHAIVPRAGLLATVRNPAKNLTNSVSIGDTPQPGDELD